MTEQFILDNPGSWNNWLTLFNPNISIKFILDNELHKYNLDGIANGTEIYEYYASPNFTLEMIEEFIQNYPENHNIQKSIEWSRIMFNPNITIDFVEKHKDIIDFNYLSGNKFYRKWE